MTTEQSGRAPFQEQQTSRDWRDRVFDAVGPTMSDAGQESLLELISEEIDNEQTMQLAREHIAARLKETDPLMPSSVHHSSVGLQLLEWRTIAALIGYLPGRQLDPATFSEISTRFASAYEAAHRAAGEVLATGLEKLFTDIKPWMEAPNIPIKNLAEIALPATETTEMMDVVPRQSVKAEVIQALGSKPVSMTATEVEVAPVPALVQAAPERNPAEPRKYYEVEWLERTLDLCASYWNSTDLSSLKSWLQGDESERVRLALNHLTALKARYAAFSPLRQNSPIQNSRAVLDDNQFKIIARLTGNGLRNGQQQLSLRRTRHMFGKESDGGLGFDNSLADAIIALVNAGVKAGEYADGKYPTGTA